MFPYLRISSFKWHYVWNFSVWKLKSGNFARWHMKSTWKLRITFSNLFSISSVHSFLNGFSFTQFIMSIYKVLIAEAVPFCSPQILSRKAATNGNTESILWPFLASSILQMPSLVNSSFRAFELTFKDLSPSCLESYDSRWTPFNIFFYARSIAGLLIQ